MIGPCEPGLPSEDGSPPSPPPGLCDDFEAPNPVSNNPEDSNQNVVPSTGPQEPLKTLARREGPDIECPFLPGPKGMRFTYRKGKKDGLNIYEKLQQQSFPKIKS